jgi:hypothetical protein
LPFAFCHLPFALPLSAAGISETQGSAEHGSGDADGGDHPQTGAEQSGSGVHAQNVERKIRLVYPARRALSHAAKAFLEVIRQA